MALEMKKLPGIVFLVGVVGFSLTACVNPLANMTEQAVEQAIESESGGDIDIDAGGGASMPDGWPSSVPVPSGDILLSAADGAEGSKNWTVVIKVGNSKDAFTEITDKLKAGGFEAITEATMDDGSYGGYQNSEYMVNVTAADSEVDGPTVTMTVIQSAM